MRYHDFFIKKISYVKKFKIIQFIRPLYIFLSDGLISFLTPTPMNCKIKTFLLRIRGAQIGDNAVIDRRVCIAGPENLVLGDDVVISQGVLMTTGGGIAIGNRVMLGYDSKLLSTNHIIPDSIDDPIRFSGHERLPITINDDAWIAANATITAGVRVGRGAVIAAGSVVTKNIPEGAIVGGVPAKLIRMRNCKIQ